MSPLWVQSMLKICTERASIAHCYAIMRIHIKIHRNIYYSAVCSEKVTLTLISYMQVL